MLVVNVKLLVSHRYFRVGFQYVMTMSTYIFMRMRRSMSASGCTRHPLAGAPRKLPYWDEYAAKIRSSSHNTFPQKRFASMTRESTPG